MLSLDEIVRTVADLLEGSRQASKAGIARDLAAQGATPDHIADSLAGFDELFNESLQLGLTEFATRLEAELRDLQDTTIH